MTWKDKRDAFYGILIGALVGLGTIQMRKHVQAAGGFRPLIMRKAPLLMTPEWFQPPELPQEPDPMPPMEAIDPPKPGDPRP